MIATAKLLSPQQLNRRLEPIFFRERIHIHSNRGKLRKYESHFSNSISQKDPSSLVILPNLSEQEMQTFMNKKSKQRHKGNYFTFKIYEPIPENTFIRNDFVPLKQSPKKQKFGSFRAIHTSNGPHSNKYFPLRSVTPIKPFRRGITLQGSSKSNTKNIELAKYNYTQQNNSKGATKSTVFQQQMPEQINGDVQYGLEKEEHEQNQNYVHTSNRNQFQVPGGSRLAGTRIQPFRRCHAKQFMDESAGKCALSAREP